MNCEKIKNLLMEYIDGELDRALEKEIKGHLAACDKCRQAEEALMNAVIEP